MEKTILRLSDDINLSAKLHSKLAKLLPEYTLERFSIIPDYKSSIKQRIESLHAAFLFILDAYPPDLNLTKDTLKIYADESLAACDLNKEHLSELHKVLEQFTGHLVSALRAGWRWPEQKYQIKHAIACLNEAEQYVLMSKGRSNTATLTTMDFGDGPEYLLQVDTTLPPYYDQWIAELKTIQSHGFPNTPTWFYGLKAEEQAYLCHMEARSIAYESIIADLRSFVDARPNEGVWPKLKRSARNWTTDLKKIHEQEKPLPDWYNKLNRSTKEMLKIVAAAPAQVESAFTSFANVITEKNTNPSFQTDLTLVTQLPQWYLLLPTHQQLFLKHVIKNSARIEDLVSFIPSRHRMLPAPANFASHRIFRINDKDEIKALSAPRFRSSHIESRDLIKAKLPEAVQQRHADSNLNQVLSYADPEQKIFYQTLISPISAAQYIPDALDSYRHFDYNLYQQALSTVARSDKAPRIIQHNHPYNVLKRYSYTTAQNPNSLLLINETEKTIQLIDKIQNEIQAVENELRILNNTVVSFAERAHSLKERLLKLKNSLPIFYTEKAALADLLTEYKNVLKSSVGSATVLDTSGRELFLSSLEQLIILTQNGYSYGSCVSGKDRKAVELIHTDAMLIYKEHYGKWAKFADNNLDRSLFVQIVADLYLSRHQHTLAGQNAPGAEGIKTANAYFSLDICNAISAAGGSISNDDRLATDNEVSHIFLNKASYLTPGIELKALLIARQLGEALCTELYDALNPLINEKRLFIVSKSKVITIIQEIRSFAEAGIFGVKSNDLSSFRGQNKVNDLPDGIKKINKLMRDPSAGNNNIQRIAKIMVIVFDRPLDEESRKPATLAVYNGLRELCQNPAARLPESAHALTIKWRDLFEASKAENSGHTSSDDEQELLEQRDFWLEEENQVIEEQVISGILTA